MARKKKIDKEMGFRLKQARTEQKLTYEELAEKSGVSSRYIKEIENHGNVPSLEKLGQHEKALADGRIKDVQLKINCENIILVARMQLLASLKRKESRGVLARTDYPLLDDENWKKNIIVSFENDGICLRIEDTI